MKKFRLAWRNRNEPPWYGVVRGLATYGTKIEAEFQRELFQFYFPHNTYYVEMI